MEHRQHCGEWARSSDLHRSWTKCRSLTDGLDATARTIPDQSCISSNHVDGFHNGAYGCGNEDVAKRRWCS